MRVAGLLAALLPTLFTQAQAFRVAPLPAGPTSSRRERIFHSRSSLRVSSNDSSSSDDDPFFQSLRQRQKELTEKTKELESKWKTGDCRSELPLVFPDWVRRMDVDYPLVACGSGKEKIYLGHLETGDLIAESTFSTESNDEDAEESSEEESLIDDADLKRTLRFMFGSYDGGGTLSIAFRGSLIVEGGRNGGVRVWRINPTSKRLVSQGSIPAMKGQLATQLTLDDNDLLWVGTHTGELHCYRLDDPLRPLGLQAEPFRRWDLGNSPVLSFELCPEYSIGAAALAGGTVELFSTSNGNSSGKNLCSLYLPFDSMERRPANAYPSQVTFVHSRKIQGSDETDGLSLVCGGSDGSIFSQPIALNDENTDIDDRSPFQEPIASLGQGHVGGGLIKGMISPNHDMLVTLGQDGCMKVWDMKKRTPYYHFAGYKVWGGSIWSDGRRLASDGVDNTVLVHDFASSDDDFC